MVVGGMCNCAHEMPRYTAFKFCLDPTTEQQRALARHAGAARFAYNQCLAMVKDALDARSTGAAVDVPFTAIDLINGFNEWKKSETAGRMFVVDQQGVAEIGVTGLPWRYQVCQQVFEGGVVDCAVAFDAWRDARKRHGRRVGFPKFKQKASATPSFRLRNKQARDKPPSPQARTASLTSCVVQDAQYITMSGSSCLAHATIPPCRCIASEKPAFFTTASTSAERTPVLQ